jgi:hypothetical protein
MKKMQIISIFLLIIGCASQSTRMSPQYKDVKINDISLAIAPFYGRIYIRYEGSVKEEFGEGEKDSLILKFFKNRLYNCLKKSGIFTKIGYSDYSVDFLWERLAVPGEDIDRDFIEVPSDGVKITFVNGVPDFILFISELFIHSSLEISGSIAPGGMIIPNADKELKITSRFAIWDNKIGKLVSYGTVDASAENILPAVTISEWRRAVDEYANEILDESPFQK